jgi:hypothetical protein
MDHAPRRMLAAALAAALTVTVAGCGGDSEDANHGDHAISATPVAKVTVAPPDGAEVIGVTIAGDSVSPSGDRIPVDRDQPIVFEIDADEAGELHVHSSPAQSIEYPAGKSQAQITIDKAGLIEAEIEDSGTLVVELEVS